MRLITTRLPVVEDGVALVVLSLGAPDAEFGDEVSVESTAEQKRLESYFVAGVDSMPLQAVPQEVVQLFGAADTASLLQMLERACRTGLPKTVAVTIYTLLDSPVEEIDGTESDEEIG